MNIEEIQQHLVNLAAACNMDWSSIYVGNGVYRFKVILEDKVIIFYSNDIENYIDIKHALAGKKAERNEKQTQELSKIVKKFYEEKEKIEQLHKDNILEIINKIGTLLDELTVRIKQ